jgi:TatD DNase family protein
MLQDAVREIPMESLLIETDGPFLAPVPRRGKRNEPSYVLYTAAKVAELKGLSLDEVAAQTTRNACKIFNF